MSPKFDIKNIAIIGAGPCGLAAAKYLLAQKIFPNIVVFEQQSQVGGVWNYSQETDSSTPHNVPQTNPDCPPDPPIISSENPPIFPSPMYETLHTNIPRALMPFTDSPFPTKKDLLIFPSRQDVQTYLINYSTPIRHLIQFSTQVQDIRLQTFNNGKDQWTIDSLSILTNKLTTSTFDAVVIATGHYSIPFIPSIPSISSFHKAHPDIITHSKYYRFPIPYKNKKVVIVGNAASGLDIASQISPLCKPPLLLSVRSATSPENLSWIQPTQELPQIASFLPESKAVQFQNGQIETNIDHIIFATGYLYSFPFLKSLFPSLITNGRRVHNLYDHLFHIDHPTLVFPGLPMKVVPLPLAQSQAAIFSRVWANLIPLPSKEEMKEWEQKEIQKRGESKYHVWERGDDSKYINEVYERISESKTEGKEPSFWSKELCWEREIQPKAKLKFELDGRKAKTLEELGFKYESEGEE
ncbi:putative thiol-specific monooxygenase [Podospora fimiseda]|uniref:Thiol-specific monooxygenase n=1 Tax=Podospora fimiseda TaxID=252190 RepID=A0AAN7BLI1_9PEZI|nr:putative thiol-specific monooxygenase [Podospora fimiseda]